MREGNAGMGTRVAFHAMPIAHAMTRGLRTSAGTTRESRPCTSIATAAMFTSGTSTPTSRLIAATPAAPATRFAAANATYVLNRNAHWKHDANVACGRRKSGIASADSAMPANVKPIPTPTSGPASPSASGEPASERNSSAGNST